MLLLLAIASVTAFGVLVPVHDHVCFFEELKKTAKATISYQVAQGDNLEIDFWVTNPLRATIFMGERNITGSYDILAEMDGRYFYCFSNKVNTKSPRQVLFDVSKYDVKFVDSLKSTMGPASAAVENLGAELRTLKAEQSYISARQVSHRAVCESSNSRVLWWSLLQVCVLSGVCLFQIYYLKFFFEKKRLL